MTETTRQLIQTKYVLYNLYQDDKLSKETYKILIERNNEAINYSQCCMQSKIKETISFDEWKVNNGHAIKIEGGYKNTYKKEDLKTLLKQYEIDNVL